MDGSCYVANSPPTTLVLPSWRRRAFELLVKAADLVWTWQHRARSRSILLGMDDRMLRDIGIDRAAAHREGTRPFWQ